MSENTNTAPAAHAAGTTSTSLNPSPTPAPTAPANPGPMSAPAGAPQGVARTPNTENVNPGAWLAGMNDDMKGYIGNKGFKDPAALAESYRNLEKLQGVPQNRLMKLPETFYDDKGALTADGRAIYERLGAPKELKDYELTAPKEGGDPARLENYLKTAHELGLTKAQAQKLAAADEAYSSQFMAAQKEQAAQAFKDGETALRKEWGAAYEVNKQSAQEGFRRLGWDGATVDAISSAIGHQKTMQMLSQLGRQVGEAAFINGNNNQNRPMEPASAKAKINELKNDKSFQAKFNAGDGDALAQWSRLHQQAYQGELSV